MNVMQSRAPRHYRPRDPWQPPYQQEVWRRDIPVVFWSNTEATDIGILAAVYRAGDALVRCGDAVYYCPDGTWRVVPMSDLQGVPADKE